MLLIPRRGLLISLRLYPTAFAAKYKRIILRICKAVSYLIGDGPMLPTFQPSQATVQDHLG